MSEGVVEKYDELILSEMAKLIEEDEVKKITLKKLYEVDDLIKMSDIYKDLSISVNVGYSTFLAKVNTLEKHKLLEKKKIPMAGNRVYLKITNDGKKIVEKMKN